MSSSCSSCGLMSNKYADLGARIGIAGTAVSCATIAFTYPQVSALSKGVIPVPTLASTGGLFGKAIVFQTVVKISQYALLRELKMWMDQTVSPGTPGLNTMLAYGITGVPIQSVLYNRLISDIYHYHGASPPASKLSGLAAVKEFVAKKIAPGIVWTFIRECGATGGALVVGPEIRKELDKVAGTEYPAMNRFVSGLIAGAICAFLTQWMHNSALKAGSMAEMGEKPTTLSCLKRVHSEMGMQLIYRNYGRRMMVIACASAVLNLCDIFKKI
eukprot:RCo038839